MIKQTVRIFKRFFRLRFNRRWVALEAALGIRIYDFSLYEKALRHPSVQRNHGSGLLQSYERLEFLGDAILGAIIAEYLYHEFPDEMEGFLTEVRSKLVSGKACSMIARDLRLGHFVELDSSTDSNGGRENDSILADCLESIIGAIYLDHGISGARKFIDQHILQQTNFSKLIARDDNYKSRLQELVQANGWEQPCYELFSANGPAHNCIFTIDVYVKGHRRGRGQATSKKKAEQLAARQAFNSLSIDELKV